MSDREREQNTQTSHERTIDERRRDDRQFDDRRFDDEVSLRDLYLILLRGLPAIFVVAVLAGAGAFLVTNLRSASYEAEATVTSSSPSVRFREDAAVVLGADAAGASAMLSLEPPQVIRIEAYRAIAFSRDVLESTRDRLGDAAPELSALRGALDLEAASGSGSSLLVHHRIAWDEPDVASAYANAWADATVERVRETLVADLEPTIQVTEAAVSQRLAELEAAEAELMTLPSGEDSAEASRERARLERKVSTARRAYATVADLEPTLEYLAELVPSGTRVLEPAAPPTDSSGPSTMLVAALAAVLGAMVATLGVFLREAVREPDARPATRSSSESHAGARAET